MKTIISKHRGLFNHMKRHITPYLILILRKAPRSRLNRRFLTTLGCLFSFQRPYLWEISLPNLARQLHSFWRSVWLLLLFNDNKINLANKTGNKPGKTGSVLESWCLLEIRCPASSTVIWSLFIILL